MGLAAPELERQSLMKPQPTPQRGAVLLLTLLMVALVASLVATTAWRQSAQIQIETAQRQRQQGQWLLQGASDWARLILREDARTGQSDHGSEPWAVPLKESRLSSFLSNQPGLSGTDLDAAWADRVLLSGGIEDAQGKFNLTNLIQGTKLDPQATAQLTRLWGLLDLPTPQAQALAQQLLQARQARASVFAPRQLEDLIAWGFDAATLARLRAHVTVLPDRTPLNVNTASAEVLAACIEGLDLGRAQRLVQDRLRSPWTEVQAARQALGNGYDDGRHGISSSHFVIRGVLRMGELTLTQTSLVKREGGNVTYVWVASSDVTNAP
jgi:general secretion pathway protein K